MRLLLVLTLQGASAAPAAICDLRNGLITSKSVGPLRIGARSAALRRRCPAVRDTLLLVRPFEQDRIDSVDGIAVGTTIAHFRLLRRVKHEWARSLGPRSRVLSH